MQTKQNAIIWTTIPIVAATIVVTQNTSAQPVDVRFTRSSTTLFASVGRPEGTPDQFTIHWDPDEAFPGRRHLGFGHGTRAYQIRFFDLEAISATREPGKRFVVTAALFDTREGDQLQYNGGVELAPILVDWVSNLVPATWNNIVGSGTGTPGHGVTVQHGQRINSTQFLFPASGPPSPDFLLMIEDWLNSTPSSVCQTPGIPNYGFLIKATASSPSSLDKHLQWVFTFTYDQVADPLCPVCGDGITDPGEECDDGGNVNGDGCSSSCTFEVGSCCGFDAACSISLLDECSTGIWTAGASCDLSTCEAGALYAIASGSNAGKLFRVSRVDAVATLVGNTGLPFQSLAFDPSSQRLLAVNDSTGELMAIDPSDASVAAVLDGTGTPIVINTATVAGLAVNPSEHAAYGVDSQGLVFRISLANGIVDPIGPVGFDRILGLGIDPVSGTIYGYFEPDGNDSLITIDASTGQGTIIASTGINDADGLTYDPTRGTLFTRDRASDLRFEIDPLTANAVGVGPMPAFGVWGFAVAYEAAVCGDGRVEVGEECDDSGESATCDVDCTIATCGDGTVNVTAGEVCDDSGESATCDADCTVASCGDGALNATAGEECDDIGESVTCDVDCTPATCGDGTLNTTAGELCDDAGESVACDVDCTDVTCGDGTLNVTSGEVCDDSGESATCDADCTFALCGDGTLNVTSGEECDDGSESTTCDLDCTLTFCGDSTLNVTAGEECDDGGTQPNDGCDDTCQVELGGCCLGDSCTVGDEAGCLGSGGSFLGFNTLCDALAVVVRDLIEMWPPNHKYHRFDLSDCVEQTVNACGILLDVDTVGTIDSIASDEPEDSVTRGDGKTTDDIVITGPHSFMLRSERLGNGNGRVYTINFTVADSGGGSIHGVCQFGVAHDQRGAGPVDDGAASGYTVLAP